MGKNTKQRVLPLGEAKTLKEPKCPDFFSKLADPLIKEPLPKDFMIKEEAGHLSELWKIIPKFQKYKYDRFIHAGGSGMVFKIFSPDSDTPLALKVVRKVMLTKKVEKDGVATSLSPIKEKELMLLKRISHPNIVRYIDSISNERGTIAVITSFIEKPQSLGAFIKETFEKHPRGVQPFSPERLDGACKFLLARFKEICSAVSYMHSIGFFHFDIKPANILISKVAYLTDLDTCIHISHFKGNSPLRVHFTWTYAHPVITSMARNPKEITGRGLKSSAEVSKKDDIERFDLFALGRTIQQSLAILYMEFGERSFASYGFRFLHIIASLLLDGKNAILPSKRAYHRQDNISFVSDTAMGYDPKIFTLHKITNAKSLEEKFARFSREYSWNEKIPELDPWQPNIVNTGVGIAPFTTRVAEIFQHPCLRRLKSEYQLGWIKEVYPSANHNRWSHSIGVFSAVVAYYNALLSDPEVPTLRILIEPEDLLHAFIAAILHDAGQTAFAHDFESALPEIFSHEKTIIRLLEDDYWGKRTLLKTLKEYWPEIKIKRMLSILKIKLNDSDSSSSDFADEYLPLDGVASDIIDGPIDADKYDYLQRDSLACGVPYGKGIDAKRFLRAISVDQREINGRSSLTLAFKEKGSPAIESLLLARYQMYGAVYWHHTFRCIQAMFVHAVAVTFRQYEYNREPYLRGRCYTKETIEDLFYHYVVCGKSAESCYKIMKKEKPFFDIKTPAIIENEKAFQFVWKLSSDKTRKLIERIARRDIYKRVYAIKIGDLGVRGDYSGFQADLAPLKRITISEKLEDIFLKDIYKAMADQSMTVETDSTKLARDRLQELERKEVPRIVIDFPIRGIPDERNFPPEIGDPDRKYFDGSSSKEKDKQRVFFKVRDLQVMIASIRVYAAPELHELIIRYLNPQNVQTCVKKVIKKL